MAHNPLLSSESAKSFTIANMGELSVKSSPYLKVHIKGTHSNQTDFTCSAILNSTFQLIAPLKEEIVCKSDLFRKKDIFEFAGWLDTEGVLLSDRNELQFVFDHNTTFTVQYNYTGEFRTYYVNDDISEDGISPGNDENDGLSPDAPMASIQVLLDRYPEIGYEDVIYVSDGRYSENLAINYVHTGVTLQGAGYDRTIIDGGQTGSCLVAGQDKGVICHLRHIGFENGKSQHGGALHLGGGEITCTIRNCRFEDNVASEKGGAIYLASSPAFVGLEVYDSVFIRNHGNKGGVMFTAQDARAKFHDCVFLENASNESGAFRIAVASSVDFVDCVFEGNFSNSVGGAINTFSTQKSTARRCLFKNNEAIGGGGAICIDSSSSMMLEDCVFEHNSSSSGGAIHTLGSSTVNLWRSVFKNNTGFKGGGLHVREQSNVSANHCLFVGNVASKAGGAIGIYNEGVFAASNCTITDNSSDDVSGGIAWHSFGDLTLVNSIIVYNPSKSWADLRLSGQGTASVSYCCTPVQCEGIGNITNTPLFLDRDGDDYRLANDSPCIDAGSPEAVDFVDLNGIPGPVDGNYDGSAVADIGAYEISSSH